MDQCQSPPPQPRQAAKPRESNRPRPLRDLQDPEQCTTQTWRSTPKAPRARSCTSQSSSRQPFDSIRLPRGTVAPRFNQKVTLSLPEKEGSAKLFPEPPNVTLTMIPLPVLQRTS